MVCRRGTKNCCDFRSQQLPFGVNVSALFSSGKLCSPLFYGGTLETAGAMGEGRDRGSAVTDKTGPVQHSGFSWGLPGPEENLKLPVGAQVGA